MNEFLNGRAGFLIIMLLVAGSIVDMVQFVWIVKRSYRKLKRVMYNKIKREILDEYKNG